eukprot:TRINITY_DN4080_c0_g2_i1.p1 TRINITY_DN4080_c0_g2~~TRINITY_DN4080_c0_g2_i1.p1  ORF type:complete len:164 (-),score=7.17 TRINITY_DN4080_c0_g2_i1:106-597(-)
MFLPSKFINQLYTIEGLKNLFHNKIAQILSGSINHIENCSRKCLFIDVLKLIDVVTKQLVESARVLCIFLVHFLTFRCLLWELIVGSQNFFLGLNQIEQMKFIFSGDCVFNFQRFIIFCQMKNLSNVSQKFLQLKSLSKRRVLCVIFLGIVFLIFSDLQFFVK